MIDYELPCLARGLYQFSSHPTAAAAIAASASPADAAVAVAATTTTNANANAFDDANSLHISATSLNARVLALRVGLLKVLPRASNTGYASKPPVFYISAQHQDWIERAALELNLPASVFRVIPTVAITAADETQQQQQLQQQQQDGGADSFNPFLIYGMDVQALEDAIVRDKATGHAPVLIVATLGSSNSITVPFQFDDIASIRQIADSHGVWVHSEGNAVLGERDEEWEQKQKQWSETYKAGEQPESEEFGVRFQHVKTVATGNLATVAHPITSTYALSHSIVFSLQQLDASSALAVTLFTPSSAARFSSSLSSSAAAIPTTFSSL